MDRSGIFNSDEVEVIGHMDGTIAIRIATLCELCGRGSRLYELNMGPVNRKICAEDYFKLTGVYPQNLEKPTTENTTQIEATISCFYFAQNTALITKGRQPCFSF